MMKTIYFSIFCILLCACSGPGEPTALKVGNVSVTQSEFEAAFKASPHGQRDTPDSRRQFLETYALRLMVLEEAINEGLDKDPKFLKEIELLWQDALSKRIMEKKTTAARTALKGKGTTEDENRILEGWLQYLKSKTPVKANKSLLGIN
jgi:hypothetical protein